MSETALYQQIGLLQQELSHVKQLLEEASKERNKFRSQAMMRANKIEGLQNELQKIYSKTSD
jgi:hypothetical protein